ncbi:MAG: histidine--tRNA ligase [Steroidobacteraceae bacterium]
MSKVIEPLRGVHDVLPSQAAAWQFLERITREVFESYGYEEFRVPIIEQTQLFKRSIGDFTDIVEKEMFSFVDQGEDHITLRPEATAGIARAMISNGLVREGRLKVWCMGPMFRRERPQAGRYRQFHQIDAEAFGFPGPDIDAEIILLSARLLRRLGLGGLKLLINSLGTPQVRAVYRDQLTAYFSSHEAALDEDSKRRLKGNPLRILDSKNPDMQRLISGAPSMLDALDAESKAHFEELCGHLRSAGIAYDVEPRLVRGLDYYTRTVFEWTTDALGSQGTVCAGGRYDGLIEQLGGASTPGIGWAMGQERIVMLLAAQAADLGPHRPHIYLVLAGERTEAQGFRLAEQMRDAWPSLRLQVNLGGGSFKAQFKRADKSGAEFALVLGEDELARGVVALKALRRDMAQEECPIAQISERLGTLLGLTRGPGSARGSGQG